MIKQSIKGLTTLSVNVTGTTGDLTSLIGLMAGKVESYKSIANGGTAVAAIPNPLNKKTFVVGNKTANGRESTIFSVPHVKSSVTSLTLYPSIIGKFDSGYESAIKSDYAMLKFDA